jgi:hypothetical protein
MVVPEYRYKAVCDKYAKYYNDETSSDFTITCKSSQWKVHKVVLAAHSDVLAKSSFGKFKVSSGALPRL